ncbi:MAG TPA: bifunctional diguanylate cyclase/phosphodiesterase, partial [Turneriella sp.]|nr:bifunctional diguanylate cyclase/phosphodiesterase [Turneriella sp.]
DRLRHTIAASERDQQYSALFFIDVDNFKNINDTSGHASGDFYLTVVAERLTTCVNEGDTVARWGGDEFVVIAENLTGSLSEAARRAELMGEKMIAALAEPCENPYARGQYFQNTVSVGLTLLYGHIHSPEELLKRADIAMYQAKMSGKNRLRNFDVRMQREIEQKLAFENDLRRAVAAGEFQLYYQPQVDAARVIFGAEVLLRWFHPTRGQVLPGDFIALAEETGDILPIGRWVIEAACKKLAQWQRDERTKHLVLSLNVSPRQFRDPQFVDYVTQAVRDTGINPRGLKLELTEGLMLDNIEETIGKMEALGKTGLSFCLDDFGTGYSSLSYLKRLPLSQIKIDQSFVRDIEVDANDAVLIRTIIGMANNLNLGVIAEGVETEEQWQMLRAMGCSAYQGFYFGRPAPAAELEALAAKL